MVVFGFLTAFVFAGVTETVTEQFPGLSAISFPTETLQIFLDDLATVSLIFAFVDTVIPICVAKDLAVSFCLRLIDGDLLVDGSELSIKPGLDLETL